MKKREAVDKENIDIKRILLKGSQSRKTIIRNKFMDNKRKLGMFIIFCGALNLYPLYTCNLNLIFHHYYMNKIFEGSL